MWKHPLSLVDVRGRVYVLNIVLYCIVLYCIVLYCIVLYCIEGGAAGWVGVGVASTPTPRSNASMAGRSRFALVGGRATFKLIVLWRACRPANFRKLKHYIPLQI